MPKQSYSPPPPIPKQDEEVKEAMSETIQQGLEKGKEALATIQEHGDDSMLGFALATHALVSMWQSFMLFFRVDTFAPGLVGMETKWHGSSSWSLSRCFALQTFAMALAAGGAAIGYDTKHKAMLNSVLLAFHLLVLADMVHSGWGGTKASGFQYNPALFHLPMLALHTMALGAYIKSGGRFGFGGRTIAGRRKSKYT